MKKLGHFYLISVLLFVSFYAQSQNIKCGQQETSTSSLVKPLGDIPTFFIGAESYIITEPEFKYSGTIPLNYGQTMNIGLPFAAVSISGNHLSFTISNEEFMQKLYKSPHKENGFFDVQVNISDNMWSGSGYIPYLVRIGIIRIIFKEY
ncbi:MULTISPECIES: hypothetical protein [Parabacteroides]|mgnify:CR=1|jgi:hypothetical protein|nr:hypothetical protein [Parabacteroides sp. AF18-52]RHR39059.1 hypothetical protein DWX23_12435 [Parabacteroides sp. AF18-52]